MKIRKPDYYDKFQCIAGACSDSCCVGWEIDIDEERREMYRSLEGDLGERMRRCVDWEDGHFILQGKEERCPFLNQEKLCDLILELGEGVLCEICREHPRYYEWYDGWTEVGVGLCCEAAARLILEQEAPAGFVTCEEETEVQEETGEWNEEDDEEKELTAVLLKARETAYQMLQNRNLSIWDRLRWFLFYVDEIQDGLDFGSLDEMEESAEYYRTARLEERDEEEKADEGKDEEETEIGRWIVENCRKLEAIDESWLMTLDELENLLLNPEHFTEMENAMNEACANRDYEYEHLAVYFVYRYFMKCRMDGDVYSKGMLMVFCVQLIHLLDVLTFSKTGKLTKEDRVQNAKNCSKEIEYSEENLEILSKIF